MSHRTTSVLALLTLATCGPSSSEVRHGCEEAVASYRRADPVAAAALARELDRPDVPAGRHDHARAVAARSARNNQRLAQMLFQRCTADHWNAAMRTCIANDRPGCPDQLPPAQFAAFDAAFTALNADLVAEKKADRDPWNSERSATCGQAAESVRIAVGPRGEDAARQLLVDVMRACMRWHFTAVNCVTDAATPAALKDCEKYLTPEQQADLHLALEPSPG